jgi:voltage-gated potassium channel
MNRNIRRMLGLGGVPPGDRSLAYEWDNRLQWPMLGVALLALPAYFISSHLADSSWQWVAHVLEAVIFAAFALELAIMLWMVRQKLLYLFHNWLNPAILILTFISLFGEPTSWAATGRLLRMAIVILMLTRMAGASRKLTPSATPIIVIMGILAFLLAGLGFWWLEPTVQSYGDGLWMAFESGMTVGYGDLVPTTPAAKSFAVLIILLAVGIMSLVTASLAAFFIGKDDATLRREMHQDLKALRREVQNLRESLEQHEHDKACPGLLQDNPPSREGRG